MDRRKEKINTKRNEEKKGKLDRWAVIFESFQKKHEEKWKKGKHEKGESKEKNVIWNKKKKYKL